MDGGAMAPGEVERASCASGGEIPSSAVTAALKRVFPRYQNTALEKPDFLESWP